MTIPKQLANSSTKVFQKTIYRTLANFGIPKIEVRNEGFELDNIWVPQCKITPLIVTPF